MNRKKLKRAAKTHRVWLLVFYAWVFAVVLAYAW